MLLRVKPALLLHIPYNLAGFLASPSAIHMRLRLKVQHLPPQSPHKARSLARLIEFLLARAMIY